MDLGFFQIREQESDHLKIRKRKDIATFLTLLLTRIEDKENKKEVANILNRFREKAGGLYLTEIEYLYSLPETESMDGDFNKNREKYRKEYKEEAGEFVATKYGKSVEI